MNQKLVHEFKSMLWVTLYFACCFGVVLLLKKLFLAQYQIEFRGFGTAVLGALLVGKVVLLLERAPLHKWVGARPVVFDVVARTVMYTLGAVLALFLEHAFHARGEYGGFGEALAGVFEHRDVNRVWATVLCVGLSFLAFNTGSVIRRHVGDRELGRLFFGTSLEEFEKRDGEGAAGE